MSSETGFEMQVQVKAMKEIQGIWIKELKYMPDDRGFLMEILRNDDPGYGSFGQCYITSCYPGVVKAWHSHEHQTDMVACIKGDAKLVLFDNREGSETQGQFMEIFFGEKSPKLVKIPPGVLHGFTAVGPEIAMMLNIPDKVYDRDRPDELRFPFDSKKIGYDWNIKNR